MKLTFFGHKISYGKNLADLKPGDLIFWYNDYSDYIRVEKVNQVNSDGSLYCTYNTLHIANKSVAKNNSWCHEEGAMYSTSLQEMVDMLKSPECKQVAPIRISLKTCNRYKSDVVVNIKDAIKDPNGLYSLIG